MPNTCSRCERGEWTGATAVTSESVIDMRRRASSSSLYTESKFGRRTRKTGFQDALKAYSWGSSVSSYVARPQYQGRSLTCLLFIRHNTFPCFRTRSNSKLPCSLTGEKVSRVRCPVRRGADDVRDCPVTLVPDGAPGFFTG